MLLLLGAALAVEPCPSPVAPEGAVQVGLDTHGHTVGGLGIATIDATSYSLSLLAPAGFELFTVSGPPNAVATGLDAWRPWLEQLPVARDLALAFTPVVEGACLVDGGRIRTRVTADGWERRWCGKGGGARATRAGDRLVLHDRLRGYTLTLIVP